MTRQFDVFANPVPALRRLRPYIMTVQSAAIGPRDRLVVMPLLSEQIVRDVPRLMPGFMIEQQQVWLAPFDPAVAPVKALGRLVSNLDAERERILAAIDLVFTGV